MQKWHRCTLEWDNWRLCGAASLLQRAEVKSLGFHSDLVVWAFLIEVLRAVGFSTRWCNWISILMATATSRILVNGRPGRPYLGHFEWFWWSSDNVIIGTNVFVKYISSGSKNEVKRPSKAKHEERIWKNTELNEFCKTQWVWIIRNAQVG